MQLQHRGRVKFHDWSKFSEIDRYDTITLTIALVNKHPECRRKYYCGSTPRAGATFSLQSAQSPVLYIV